MDYAIVVIDIGMTNKKVALYDDALKQVDAHYRNFPPVLIDGIETHDLEAMEEWFIQELAAYAAHYPIKVIAVTTHGATFVCVGKDGKPSVPCVYYTHEPGDAFHARFYERFGSPEALQARTGTPALKGMINTGKGICFAQEHYPEQFKRTLHLLQYPQYWGYRFSGNIGAEGTYMGCHGYLWDHGAGRLSSVAEGLGVADCMPKQLGASWGVLGTITGELAAKTGLSPAVIVTMGLHDSNSSLLPHFAKKGETGFVLNSTGTWCVSMNPVKQYGFAPEELGKVVFFNISAFGTPVKTAIFLGGQEFETWSGVLKDIHGRTDVPPYNASLYRTLLQEKNAFLLPELTAGSGQFPQSKPQVVENSRDYPFADIAAHLPPSFQHYETGIALLQISLVMQTLTALERTGLAPGAAVFTEGGFRKNEAYNILVSAALGNNQVFLTDIAEATALGAAMTAKMALTGKKLQDLGGDFEIDYQEVVKTAIPEIALYREAWLELARNTRW
ncbi:MAG: carbohydrate kinase [Treponema sp.]|jgi:sugar (pentulose or hexulose) kinase|nr:carbohydrate kinase [Treponema sp.]